MAMNAQREPTSRPGAGRAKRITGSRNWVSGARRALGVDRGGNPRQSPPDLEARSSARADQPLVLPEMTQPEPDLSVIRGRIEDFRVDPRARDVLLLVGVAGATLRPHRERKGSRDARLGVPEYTGSSTLLTAGWKCTDARHQRLTSPAKRSGRARVSPRRARILTPMFSWAAAPAAAASAS